MNFAELKNRKHDIINIAKPRWRWRDDFGLREMGRWRGFGLREMGRWRSRQGEGDGKMGRWRSFQRWGDGEMTSG